MVSFNLTDEYSVQIIKFTTNDRLCPYIVYHNTEDGHSFDEPYGRMAVNLPEDLIEENQFFFNNDLNHNLELVRLIEDHKYFKRMNIYGQSGFSEFEIWQYLGPMEL
jgi:hypothetical protein